MQNLKETPSAPPIYFPFVRGHGISLCGFALNVCPLLSATSDFGVFGFGAFCLISTRFVAFSLDFGLLRPSSPRNVFFHNIFHSKFDIRNFSAPWTAFVPPPPLHSNQKTKNYEPFHERWTALSFSLSATEWGRGPGRGGRNQKLGPRLHD